MNKKAKEFLRAIQEKADRDNTYYVILKTYWSFSSQWEVSLANELGVTEEIWNDMYKLNERYQNFCHYIKEVKPDWQVIETIPFADNSVEVVEKNKYGETRQRMTDFPKGDQCY